MALLYSNASKRCRGSCKQCRPWSDCSLMLVCTVCPDLSVQNLRIITGRIKWIWYLSHMRAAKVQASLRIRAVSPEPPLLAHTSIESRGTFRQKARSLAPLNGWACAVKICHDGMLKDTNSLDRAHYGNPVYLYLMVIEQTCHREDMYSQKANI